MKDCDLVTALVEFAALAEKDGFSDVSLNWRMMANRVITGRAVDIRPEGERSQPLPPFDPKSLDQWIRVEVSKTDDASEFIRKFHEVVDALARIGHPPPDPEIEARRIRTEIRKAESTAISQAIEELKASTPSGYYLGGLKWNGKHWWNGPPNPIRDAAIIIVAILVIAKWGIVGFAVGSSAIGIFTLAMIAGSL